MFVKQGPNVSPEALATQSDINFINYKIIFREENSFSGCTEIIFQ